MTVSGVDDRIDDDDVGYWIATTPATSQDPKYNAYNAADVSLVNADDDTAGITISQTNGLVTSEDGGQAIFAVVLNSEPIANVTVDLTSSDPGEGTLSQTSLTFKPEDWDTPQFVTITGIDDQIDDGDVAFTIETKPANSADPKYHAQNAADVSVTNLNDEDKAGVTIEEPTSGLTTSETGDQATLSVKLNSEPTADVTITLTSDDTSEGEVLTGSLTFTVVNWSTPQTVTVAGLNDDIDDGDFSYTLTTTVSSADLKYDSIPVPKVSVLNLDDADTAGVTISVTSLDIVEGAQALFTVALESEPTANVTVELNWNDPAAGGPLSSLTFTPADWSTAQTVTVNAADDQIDDGDSTYTIDMTFTGSDEKYSELDVAGISVTIVDNDEAGIIIEPTTDLTTSEAGGQATFTVVLCSEPVADVTIDLPSTDLGEGTVQPASITFTSANWETPQTVTVHGVDDLIDDGDTPYSIATEVSSDDSKYSALDPADVSLVNADDDTAGIAVEPITGLVTSEDGGQAVFAVVLNSEPIANVTIDLTSSDPGEGTLLQTSMTFSPEDWNTPQSVTITGTDDQVDDEGVDYTIEIDPAGSADPQYQELNAVDVPVTNADNGDTAGITVSPTSGLTTSETGDQATFTVVLRTEPTADVTVTFDSSDVSEGEAVPASLTFTAVNWSTPQTVSVAGVNDNIDDGDVSYSITTAVSSDDSKYSVLDPADVSLVNADDDPAGVTISPIELPIPEGGDASFTVSLNSEPIADVAIALSMGQSFEGVDLPTEDVTFTPQNWNTPQTITIANEEDQIAHGLRSTTIHFSANSDDPLYHERAIDEVMAMVLDNDPGDMFERPDASDLGPDWVAGTGFGIDNHQALVTSESGAQLALVNGSNSIDEDGVVVEADFDLGDAPGHAGLVVRATADGLNLYLAALTYDGSSTTAQLWKEVEGAWTPLRQEDVSGQALAGRLQFAIVEHTMEFRLNGTLLALALDSELATAGLAGVRGTDGVRFDNVTLTPVSLTRAALPYSQDFNHPDGDLPAEWTSRDGQFVLQSGRAVAAEGTATGHSTATLNSQTRHADVIVEADIDLRSDLSTSYAGLVARYTGPQDGNMYFGAIVKWPDKYEAHLWVNLEGSWINLACLTIADAEVANDGVGRLTFQVHGDSLRLSFNNQVVAAVTDNQLPGPGYVGIRGNAGESFDDIYVVESTSVEQPGNLATVYGDVTAESVGTPPVYKYTVNLPSSVAIDQTQSYADVVVEAEVGVRDDVWLTHAGLVARCSGPTLDEMYLGAIVRWPDRYEAHLWIKKDGIWRNLTVQPIADANDGIGRLQLKVHGDYLGLYFNGQGIAAATNSELVAGYAGIRGSEGETLDQFSVTASTSPPMVGDLQVVSGDFTAETSKRFVANLPPSTAVNTQVTATDMTVKATVQLASGVSAAGLVARWTGPGDDNYYWGTLVSDGTSQSLQIYRKLNGTVEHLGSQPTSATGGLLQFSVLGDLLRLSLETDVLDVTDTAITGAGFGGVRGYPDSIYENVSIKNESPLG